MDGFNIVCVIRFFLRFRFGDRKEILRDRLEEFERPFSIDVISSHYILRDRWWNLRDRFGPSKHLKKTLCVIFKDLNPTVGYILNWNVWLSCERKRKTLYDVN